MTVLIDILRFCIVFGLAVIVHEYGHMIVAKLCGARVDVFSVGFGRKIFGFKYGETEYQIAMIPFGGYVKIAGMDPGEELTGAPWEFLSISPWRRILILAAGPGMNIVLAFVIYYVLFVGVGQAVTPTTTIGVVPEGSPGWEIGLHPDDTILAVGETPVETWDDVEMAIVTNPDESLKLKIKRGKDILQKSYTASVVRSSAAEEETDTPQKESAQTDEPLANTDVQGFRLAYLDPNGPASKAGLTTGSVITAVAGTPHDKIDRLRNVLSQQVRINEQGEAEAIPFTIKWVDPQGKEHEEQVAPDVHLPAEDAQPYRPVARLGFSYNGTYDRPADLEDLLQRRLPILDVAAKLEPVVGAVKEGSPAAKAGLEKGDRILTIDGEPVEDWNALQGEILSRYEKQDGEYAGIPMTLSWRTASGEIPPPAKLVPVVREEILPTEHGIRTGQKIPIVEIGFQRLQDRQRMGIIGAVPASIGKVKDSLVSMVGLLGKLVTGGASRKVFGGPIAIYRFSAETGKWGFERFFMFIAMLSTSLALLNLLPIPALDGGHIMLNLVEMVRRQPLTLQQIELWGRIGVFFFILPLMIFFIFNDLEREGLISFLGQKIMALFGANG